MVAGTVFRDLNGNGIRDPGEAGIAGSRIFVDLNGDGIWERGEPRRLTNRLGRFSFKLPSGTYQIRETPRLDFAPTAASSLVLQLTVTAGQTLSGIDFGNLFTPPKHAGRVHPPKNREGLHGDTANA